MQEIIKFSNVFTLGSIKEGTENEKLKRKGNRR